MHLGNARIAAFNWLFARRSSGAFIVRIEDTDQERQVVGAEDGILEDLTWLGLDWDEGPDRGGASGPYRQSERLGSHQEALNTLMRTGRAFPCFCPPGAITADRRYAGPCRELGTRERTSRLAAGEAHAVRFASPRRGVVRVSDTALGGETSFPAADIDDFVLRRAQGGHTYNFAAAVDDLNMEITHVIRGSGHFSNTPKQVLVLTALGARAPIYTHLPTVLGPDGRRLAKRHGATPVRDLRRQGIPSDAVVNYISLLGWSHPEQKEFLTRDELIESVSLERLGRAEVRIDPLKLRWLSERHIAAQPLSELARRARRFADPAWVLPEGSDWSATVDALRSRLQTYADIRDQLGILYPGIGQANNDLQGAHGGPRTHEMTTDELELLRAVRAGLEGCLKWEAKELSAAVRGVGDSVGTKGAGLYHPVRRALIGVKHGPELGKVIAALGRAETKRRLDAVIGQPAPGC